MWCRTSRVNMKGRLKMIVVLKQGSTKDEVKKVVSQLEAEGVQVQINAGTQCTVLGVLGDTSLVDTEKYQQNPHVEKVVRVQEPYKKASRKFHPQDTVVDVAGVKIGGERLAIIAGPCSVESEKQILSIAQDVKTAGAGLLRGGAYKPRTSPYSFQGLELEGLKLLKEAKEKTGLPIVTEIMSPRLVETFERDVDVIQVGARNMQNFDLLKELGKCRKPILLKRGLSSTIEEWLMSAEYIMAGGNPNVILCERGIRTFETYTRNTLDISAVLAVKKQSHLPIVIDPSHATGMAWMVDSLAMAAIAAGADGLIVEVHNDPKNALCDGPQSITPVQFANLTHKIGTIASVVGRTL